MAKLGGVQAETEKQVAQTLQDMSRMQDLIEICAGRDGATQKSVQDRLAGLAARDPALVLQGLEHPRLAARMLVANLLRARLGDAFDVDPWSDAASRQKAVAQWRARLAAEKPTAGKTP